MRKKINKKIKKKSKLFFASLIALFFIFSLFFFANIFLVKEDSNNQEGFLISPVYGAVSCSDYTDFLSCTEDSSCSWEEEHGGVYGGYCYPTEEGSPAPGVGECTAVGFEWGKNINADVSGNYLHIYNSSDYAFEIGRTITGCPIPEYNEPPFHQLVEDPISVQYYNWNWTSESNKWLTIGGYGVKWYPSTECSSGDSACSYNCCQNSYDIDSNNVIDISGLDPGNYNLILKVSGGSWSEQGSVASFTILPGPAVCDESDECDEDSDCGSAYWATGSDAYRCVESILQRKRINNFCDTDPEVCACYSTESWYNIEDCAQRVGIILKIVTIMIIGMIILVLIIAVNLILTICVFARINGIKIILA